VTAYLFVKRKESVQIYQDTLVSDLSDPAHASLGRAEKIRYVDYLNCAVCGAGALFFTDAAHKAILINNAYDIEEAGEIVSYFTRKYLREIPEAHDVKIQLYVLGVNPQSGLSDGYAITETGRYEPVRIGNGMCVNNVGFRLRTYLGRPILPNHEEAAGFLLGLDPEFRNEAGIGGDLMWATINRDGFSMTKAGIFP